MKLDNLYTILKSEPAFRARQANKYLFQDFIASWDEATAFSKPLRAQLSEECSLEIKAEEKIDASSVKALITLSDGLEIETVLMRHADGRNTVCVSSQVGCPLGCSFCATGAMGFKRNLHYWEIVEQVVYWGRQLKNSGEHVNNLVFMGMGEPFMNYTNVLRAIKMLNDKEMFAIGARHISVSTAGIPESIKNLYKENIQLNLAISLHAANDRLRSRLMPVNNRFPLAIVLKSVDEYIKKTKRRVMFEYLMIKGVNDSLQDAKELATLMAKPLYLVNLIVYNKTGKNNFEPSDGKSVRAFKEVLEKSGVTVTQRHGFGSSIAAACGQLATGRKR